MSDLQEDEVEKNEYCDHLGFAISDAVRRTYRADEGGKSEKELLAIMQEMLAGLREKQRSPQHRREVMETGDESLGERIGWVQHEAEDVEFRLKMQQDEKQRAESRSNAAMKDYETEQCGNPLEVKEAMLSELRAESTPSPAAPPMAEPLPPKGRNMD